jgi:glutathione synthase/RimK-type ligase-like ATP-grasp enzyme
VKDPARRPIALVTESRYESGEAPPGDWYYANLLADDAGLVAALAELGHRAVRVDWARPGVDWGSHALAVFRTPWDYFDRFEEFMAWFARVEPIVPLLNRGPLVRWNLDKRYLRDLQARGIAIPPSLWMERGQRVEWARELDARAWDEVVVKPVVSGAARDTHRVRRAELAGVTAILDEVLRRKAVIVQPFLHSIVSDGEVSCIVIDGVCTHGVRKRPRPGDFRVQDDHGGTVEVHEPTQAERQFAEASVAACPHLPVYARVDIVRDPAGNLLLMELELVEPELFLRYSADATRRLAEAIARSLA